MIDRFLLQGDGCGGPRLVGFLALQEGAVGCFAGYWSYPCSERKPEGDGLMDNSSLHSWRQRNDDGVLDSDSRCRLFTQEMKRTDASRMPEPRFVGRRPANDQISKSRTKEPRVCRKQLGRLIAACVLEAPDIGNSQLRDETRPGRGGSSCWPFGRITRRAFR